MLKFLENIFNFDFYEIVINYKRNLKDIFEVNPKQHNIEIIKQFNLSPHPEGGWFREIVRSQNDLTREDGQIRNFITGIYYLLERDAKSVWHRVKNADEI